MEMPYVHLEQYLERLIKHLKDKAKKNKTK